MNLEPYHGFAVFRGGDWEAGTHPLLSRPVSDLRTKLRENADSLFFKGERLANERIRQPQALGQESRKLALFIDTLQAGLATSAVKCAGEFQEVAAANAGLIDADSLDWAYAQAHGVLCTLLNISSSPDSVKTPAKSSPEGHRLRTFLMTVCDGEREISSDTFLKAIEGAATDSNDWMTFHLRPEWLAPEWVQAYLRSEPYDRTHAWRRLDEKATQAVLEVFVRNSWLELESRFDEAMRSLRISLSQHGVLTTASRLSLPNALGSVAAAGASTPSALLLKYRSGLKRAILIQLTGNPRATDLEICRGLDADGSVDLPGGWIRKPSDRSFADAYLDSSRRHKVEATVSKVRQDLRKMGLLPNR